MQLQGCAIFVTVNFRAFSYLPKHIRGHIPFASNPHSHSQAVVDLDFVSVDILTLTLYILCEYIESYSVHWGRLQQAFQLFRIISKYICALRCSYTCMLMAEHFPTCVDISHFLFSSFSCYSFGLFCFGIEGWFYCEYP